MTSPNEWKLPTNVRPTLYTLTLEPDLDDFTFAGSETIALEVDEPTSEIKMNSSEIAVRSANLTLPDGFTPRPLDGEVEDFSRLPVRDVGETVRTSLHTFKYNCNLVIIDFLIRRGFITPDDPDYVELVTGLRVPVT